MKCLIMSWYTTCLFQEEDDWKEFEQEEIDYSGLRVQSMQIRYYCLWNTNLLKELLRNQYVCVYLSEAESL